MSVALNKPHGGRLQDLLVTGARAAELRKTVQDAPAIDLTERQLCDLELLICGGFSPLRGFMNEADYESVCASMRLADGTLWPIPVTLDLPQDIAAGLRSADKVALRAPAGSVPAVLTVTDIYRPDKTAEAVQVYGTTNTEHPGVAHLLRDTGTLYVGGTVEALSLPVHDNFRELRRTPVQLRDELVRLIHDERPNVVAFQTRNPMHRAHYELTMRAVRERNAVLLLHPVVGPTKPGDIPADVRVKCYQALLPYYPEGVVTLSVLPLAMRMAGPREALWHAIIRKNYGCSHLVVGRNHAGPGTDSAGNPFYGPCEAQELFAAHQEEIGVEMVAFEPLVYVPEREEYAFADEVRDDERALTLSGTELRKRLADGREIPEWFTFPEVARELDKARPKRRPRGTEQDQH